MPTRCIILCMAFFAQHYICDIYVIIACSCGFFIAVYYSTFIAHINYPLCNRWTWDVSIFCQIQTMLLWTFLNTVYIYGCTCACIYIGYISRNWSVESLVLHIFNFSRWRHSLPKRLYQFTLSPAVYEYSYCSMSLWILGIINHFNIIILMRL